MTTIKQFDIAIVGGGMAGSSLALLLAKKIPLLSIALIETLPLHDFKDQSKPASLPSYDDRSSALSLGSCRIFQALDIWSELLPFLEPIKQVHVSDRGHPAGTLLDSREIDSINDELGYVIENRRLGSVLLNNICNTGAITLFSPATVLSIKPKEDSVDLVIKPSSLLINTKLLVVADGAESGLREQLGIAVDITPYHQAAVIANVTTSTFHQYIAYERFTDTGPMALLPLQDFNGEHRSALVWTVDEKFVEDVARMNDAEFLQHIQQRFGSRLGFFTKAGKRHIYPLVLHKAREQVRSHIVLMGNAAHGMHPVAGQGFNLSLRDCLALAEVLQTAVTNTECIGSLPVLQRYLDQQSWDQEKTITTSHLLTLLFSTAEPAAAFARNAGLLGLNFLPGIKNWFAKQAMGIGERGFAKK
jgi:2-polyprenyl-6-methoxyphenol 4-hydroxylase